MPYAHVSLVLATSLLAAAQDAPPKLSDFLSSNEQLATFSSLLSPPYIQIAEQRAGFRVDTVTDTIKYMEEAVNITILAPTENAFRYFPQSALDSITEDDILYHVLREGGMPALTSSMIPDDVAVMRSTLVRDLDSPALAGLVVREGQLRAIGARGQWANVTQADIPIANGVVHLIDQFLPIAEDLVGTAFAINLTAFLGAFEKPLSEGRLPKTGVTVFAPRNEAFERIACTMQNIPEGDLPGLLAAHVVPGTFDGEYIKSAVGNGTEMETLLAGLTSGDESILFSTCNDGKYYVSGELLLATDIPFEGGILHVIDGVLEARDNSDRTCQEGTETSTAAQDSATCGALPSPTDLPTPTTTVTLASLTAVSEETAQPAAGSNSGTTGNSAAVATAAVGAAALFGGAAAMLVNFQSL